MILPSKHLRGDRALLCVGAELLRLLEIPRTVSGLWESLMRERAKRVGVARLSFDDPHGWHVAQERRVFFVKNRFLWIRDRFHFPEAMRLSVGPVWHVADVAPVAAAQDKTIDDTSR